MQLKNINKEVGYLGPNERIIYVRDDQNMVLQEDRNVPFWMTPQERISTKFSQYDNMQLKDKTNDKLLGIIKIAGVDSSVVEENRVGQMQDIDLKNYIYAIKIIRK